MKNSIAFKDKTIDLTASANAKSKARAILHPLRQKLLAFIDSKGQTTVTPIYTKLKLEQAVCSMHLGILRRAGLVTAKRSGKQIHYSANRAEIDKFLAKCSGL